MGTGHRTPRLAPYDPIAARSLASELDLPWPAAVVLARRGLADPAQARSFLEATTEHPAALLEGLAEASRTLIAAIEAGSLVTVHGDYDCDGVCATAVLVEAIRARGGECDWIVPSRFEDGYGLAETLPERLAERGTGLLVTVDCGIGAAELIAKLSDRGIGTIVTDHHTPPAQLPGCPVLHPALGGYPFAGLCGTAVAARLAESLGGDVGRRDELVALATVADAMPMVDENRRLVRAGLARMHSSPSPGIRELIAVAALEPTTISAGDLAFRLAPRINAAGRLGRADAGVELLLTDSSERAREIAGELDRLNHDRREVEGAVRSEALALARDAVDTDDPAGIVVAGQGWHEGVVGIVASKLVERFERPAVVLTVDTEGRAKGSARSVPGIDLVACLDRCSELLDRHGGHAAAAGCELDATLIDPFSVRFAQAVADAGADAAPVSSAPDVIVGAADLDLTLAGALAQLEPTGNDNPEPMLEVAGARVCGVERIGTDGAHARLEIESAGRRARAIAFRAGERAGEWETAPVNVNVSLAENHWNGSVSAQAVVHDVQPFAPAAPEPCCGPAEERPAEYLDAIADALGPVPEPSVGSAPEPGFAASPLARVADLVSSGAPVTVICADARRRAGVAAWLRASGAGAERVQVSCSRCAADAQVTPAELAPVLTDWEALGRTASHAGPDDGILAMIDPPPGAMPAWAMGDGGFALWGPGEVEFAREAYRWAFDTRRAARSIFGELRGGEPEQGGAKLARALAGPGSHPLTPAGVARALKVLAELGVVEIVEPAPGRDGLRVRVVSSKRTRIESSASFRAFESARAEVDRFLSTPRQAA